MTESQAFKPQFGYLWVTIAALAAVSGLELIKFYSMTPYAAQASFVGWSGVVMFFSPLIFTLVPRSYFNRPALLLLTWWTIPLSMCWIAFQHLIMENTNERFYGLFLGPAALWAMFVPVIVGGVIRDRANQKRK